MVNCQASLNLKHGMITMLWYDGPTFAQECFRLLTYTPAKMPTSSECSGNDYIGQSNSSPVGLLSAVLRECGNFCYFVSYLVFFW